MKILGYFIYGTRPEYQLELTFSVLSALRLLKENKDEVKIVVLTDRSALSPELPVEILPLSKMEMAEWTRNGEYNHRAKLCAVLRLLNHYGVPTVLVDTDTYFMDDPAKLFTRILPGQSLMYGEEDFRIGEYAEWQPIVAEVETLQREGMKIDRDTMLLNSGVIGVLPEHAALIERAIDAADRLYSIAPVFNIEQFAASIGLWTGSEIAFCNDLLGHYWGHVRPFIRLRVQRFLLANQSASTDSLIAGSVGVDVTMPKKAQLDKLLARVLAKVHGWSPGYRFAYLSYRTALAYAKKDPEFANLWMKAAIYELDQAAKTELNQAKAGPDDLPSQMTASVWRDFPVLRKGRIDSLSWLDSATKAAWESRWRQSA